MQIKIYCNKIKKILDIEFLWCYNSRNLITKAMTKTSQNRCFQRVDGWCESTTKF